jgi:hypothetical protein
MGVRTSTGGAAFWAMINPVFPSDPVTESLKVITLNVNNGTQHLNCFLVTNTVEVFKLCGFITTAGTLTNCTGAYFNMWDGTVRTAITKNDGVLSGLAVDSAFFKTAAAGTTMSVANNVAAVLTEPAADKNAFSSFIVTAKTGVATYIAFSYSSTDTPVDATFTICCEYRTLDSGLLTPV